MAKKKRVVFCFNCLKDVPATYIGTNDSTIERTLLGLITLGLNEVLINRYYRCPYCGNLIRK